jgi:hypothetical protein
MVEFLFSEHILSLWNYQIDQELLNRNQYDQLEGPEGMGFSRNSICELYVCICPLFHKGVSRTL